MTCPLISPTLSRKKRPARPTMRDLPQRRSKTFSTVRIETNLWQGDRGVEVDSVEGDFAETEAPEEQSRRTQKQIFAEEVISRVDEEVSVAVRQHGWTCTQRGLWLTCGSAGNSTGGRAHSPTAMLWFLLLNSLMSSLSIVESQIPMERERRRLS